MLRGPQSTLYGRNAQAGVVNIISRKPTNKLEVRASAGYGSYNARDLQLSLSDAIVPDKFFYCKNHITEYILRAIFLGHCVSDVPIISIQLH